MGIEVHRQVIDTNLMQLLSTKYYCCYCELFYKYKEITSDMEFIKTDLDIPTTYRAYPH